MDHTRRNLCLLLPALFTASGSAATDGVLPSKAYPFESLPVRGSARPVMTGETHGGFRIEVHETDLAPGAMPHPPHRHIHEEMFLIREGAVAVTINGQTSRIGPGSVAYIASNDLHGIRNVGESHAQYFVVALGRDNKAAARLRR